MYLYYRYHSAVTPNTKPLTLLLSEGSDKFKHELSRSAGSHPQSGKWRSPNGEPDQESPELSHLDGDGHQVLLGSSFQERRRPWSMWPSFITRSYP